MNNKEYIEKLMNNKEYIKKFWVGLMDGDGSIQVNHWRKSNLQYRLIIKLSNIIQNYNMLISIAKIIGGNVLIINNKFIIWVVNDEHQIRDIINIFNDYPLLTSRKICQYNFLKYCLNNKNTELYLFNRDYKYDLQKCIINSFINKYFIHDTDNNNLVFNKQVTLPTYFLEWLSGFVEAEGCFSIRQSNNHSFSIGQNYDYYLLHFIKYYLRTNSNVRNSKNNFYSLEIYNKLSNSNLINHLKLYPLLGAKLMTFNKWKVYY